MEEFLLANGECKVVCTIAASKDSFCEHENVLHLRGGGPAQARQYAMTLQSIIKIHFLKVGAIAYLAVENPD